MYILIRLHKDQSSINVLTLSFSLSKADLTVKQKFENHRSGMVTLTKDEADLEASLPKAGVSAAVISGSSVRYGRHIFSCYAFGLVCTGTTSINGGCQNY